MRHISERLRSAGRITPAKILILCGCLLCGCDQSTPPPVVPPVTGGPAPAAKTATPLVPDWLPDSTLISQFAPSVNVAGYSLRLPQGYSPHEAPAMGSTKATERLAWNTAPRSDGSASSLVFLLGDSAAGMQPNMQF